MAKLMIYCAECNDYVEVKDGECEMVETGCDSRGDCFYNKNCDPLYGLRKASE